MNSHLSSPFQLAQQCAGLLPTEMINKILKTHEGLIHPCAMLIKQHMKEEYVIPYTQIDYFVKYEGLSPDEITESLLDIEFLHMTLECDSPNGYDSWTGSYALDGTPRERSIKYEDMYWNELLTANPSLAV